MNTNIQLKSSISVVTALCCVLLLCSSGVVATADTAIDSKDVSTHSDYNSAQTISEGEISDSISDGHNIYAISLEAGDTIDTGISFNEAASNYPNIEIQNAQGQEIQDDTQLTSPTSSTVTEQANAEVQSTGTYYLYVYANGDSTTDYTLSVDRNENDQYEPNGIYDRATSVTAGTYEASVLWFESDIYKINLNEGDTLNASVTFDEEVSNYPNIEIQNAQGQEVADDTQLTSPIRETVTERAATEAESTGTYYIYIDGNDDSTTDYTLSINRNGNDQYEPNGIYDRATSVTDGEYDAEMLWFEDDVYKIDLDGGDTLNASVTFNEEASNYPDVAIQNAQGEEIQDDTQLTSPTSDTVTERAATEVQSTDTYYIYIDGNDDSTTKYTLSVDRNKSDQYEPNGVYDRATSITNGTYDASVLWYESDIYEISLNEGDTLNASVSFDEDASNYPDVAIQNAQGEEVEDDTQILSPAGEIVTERAATEIQSTGTYYIYVDGNDDSTTDYTLSVNRNENDQYEPNGVYSHATSVTRGTYEASVLWFESDIYQVNLDAGDTVNASVTFDEGVSNYPDVAIQNAQGEEIEGDDQISSSVSDSVTERAVTEVQAAGTYYIYVEGSDSSTAEYTLSVEGSFDQQNTNPIAQFSYTPASPAVGDSITFDADESTDPDGEITSYQWDFDGDGTTDATGDIVSHTYQNADDYTVELVVTDEAEATGTTTQIVEVVADEGDSSIPADAVYSSGSAAADYDQDTDGQISLTELASAGAAYTSGELGLTELANVGAAYSRSSS